MHDQFNSAHSHGRAVIDLWILKKIDLLHGSVSIHHQNIRQPAIEMFKTLKDVIIEFTKWNFKLKAKYFASKYKGLNSIFLLYVHF